MKDVYFVFRIILSKNYFLIISLTFYNYQPHIFMQNLNVNNFRFIH